MVENAYNGDGRRVIKTVNGASTYYLYEYDKVILETNVFGDVIGRNVYGLNLLIRTVGIDTFYYMYNGHADVTALLTPAGQVAASYYYDAFGNVLETTGNVDNSILFAGYQYDKETGLYYLNARMYDPITARFMQEDTYLGQKNNPLSLNLYTYCHNSPLMYWDPTGHSAEATFGGQKLGANAANDNMAQREMRKTLNRWNPIASSVGDAARRSAAGSSNNGYSYSKRFETAELETTITEVAKDAHPNNSATADSLAISKPPTSTPCPTPTPMPLENPNIIYYENAHLLSPDVRTGMFFARYPIIAFAIGTVETGKTNISTNAHRFASNHVVLPLQRDIYSGEYISEGTQENAVRHVLWQATIAAIYGEEIARWVGSVHEINPDALKRIDDVNAVQFASLSLADEAIDLLNNEIGIEIASNSDYTSMRDLAFETIEYYHQNGLWVAEELNNGYYSIIQDKLTEEQYQAALNRLNILDDNGFEPGNEKYKPPLKMVA